MTKRILGFVLAVAVVFYAAVALAESKAKGPKQDKKDAIQEKIAAWDKELNLTPAEKTKMHEILLQAKQEIQKLKKDYKLQADKAAKEEAKSKIKEIRRNAHDQIAGLLTPEQKTKFKEIRQKKDLDNKDPED
jgi:Spy/CpxP family protein refolding chaperone